MSVECHVTDGTEYLPLAGVETREYILIPCVERCELHIMMHVLSHGSPPCDRRTFRGNLREAKNTDDSLHFSRVAQNLMCRTRHIPGSPAAPIPCLVNIHFIPPSSLSILSPYQVFSPSKQGYPHTLHQYLIFRSMMSFTRPLGKI